MARLFELLAFGFIIYMFVRRLVAPFRRGFAAREQERKAQAQRTSPNAPDPKNEVGRVDRSNLKDAEFKDL